MAKEMQETNGDTKKMTVEELKQENAAACMAAVNAALQKYDCIIDTTQLSSVRGIQFQHAIVSK